MIIGQSQSKNILYKLTRYVASVPWNQFKNKNKSEHSLNCKLKYSILTIIQFGLPTAHKLILASSPPVTITRPDFWPKARHVTADP